MFSIRQIEYFVAVAETGQVSKAAVKLHVSQSTITMAIKNIEEVLNTELFSRHHQGFKLTYKGEVFLRHSKNVVFSMEEALKVNDEINRIEKGKLRLAVSLTISGYFLAGHYARFLRNFPGIEIILTEDERVNIEKGLEEGIYDLGMFDISNLKNRETLACEKILNSSRRLWVYFEHPLLKETAVSLKEVAEYPYIMITVDEAEETALDYWKESGCTPKVIFKTNSIEAVRSMVGNGNGITILADLVYRPWSSDGQRIKTINLSNRIPDFVVGLVWSKKREMTPSMETFRRFLNLTAGSTSLKM